MSDKPKKWEDLDWTVRELALEWHEKFPNESYLSLWKKVATAEMRSEVDALMLRHLRAFFAPYELAMRAAQPRCPPPFRVRSGSPLLSDQAVMALVNSAKYCPVGPGPIGWQPSTHRWVVAAKGSLFNWSPMRTFVIDEWTGVKRVVYQYMEYGMNEAKRVPIIQLGTTVEFVLEDGVSEFEVRGHELYSH